MIRTIDFNNLSTGETVENQYSDIGVRILASETAGGENRAMIFDTNNPTGGDDDLATDNLDNVLIISEDGNAANPDDNMGGGTFTFEFDNAVDVKSLTFLDTEAPARMVFFGADGAVLSDQFVPPAGDNGQSVVQLFVPGTVRMEVIFQGSGALDNLVFEDNNVVPVDGDGIVSGDDTGNVIDLGYEGDPEGDRIDAGDALIAGEAPDDDIVDALGGDDSVTALEGDDDVYAGAGDDTVSGGEGDDLIFGDRTLADGDVVTGGGSGERESFNWSEAGFAPGETVTSFTQDTGSVNVTFNTLSATPKTTTAYSEEVQRTDGIDGAGETVSATSSLSSETRLEGQEDIYELSFDTPVSNVDFNINDIDGDSVVRVQAFDADGNPLEVTLVGGSGLALTDTDGVAGNDTADADGGYASADNAIYSLQVDIAGPVSRIEILHGQNGAGNTSVNITDVFFDADEGVVVNPGEDGNDVLSGDAGNDTIFGEGGDDVITGGIGADSLSGGDDADLFVGGDAGDVVDGGAGGNDDDTLDLTDSGPLRVVDETVDADGNSTSGTVEFLDDAGGVTGTMSFAEIENLVGVPTGPQGPTAVDDAATTLEDTAVVVDLRGNDTDPDDAVEDLVLSDITVPAEQGTVVDNGDGTVTFTPAENFTGEATITYTVTDPDGAFDTGEAVVDVTPVNDAPDAVDDADTTPFATPVTVDLLANDTDVDNTAAELSVVSATVPAEQGTLTPNADGTFEFTPADGFTGEAVITYTITDGDLTDTAIHTVTVAEGIGPEAFDDAATTPEDTAVVVDLRGNDFDGNDPLEDLVLSDITVPAEQGTVVDNGDGTVTFTPAENFNGEATIT
ncbi:cadherin-like domain-containing protein, partial [uncultured Sulfitobacter sp.]|uniref:cadherin-like domain-containing protein n=1 Tax=uncultured Sulfitobacter sp. TaxID=191468 RepID=UPI002638E097